MYLELLYNLDNTKVLRIKDKDTVIINNAYADLPMELLEDKEILLNTCKVIPYLIGYISDPKHIYLELINGCDNMIISGVMLEFT